MKVLGRVYLRVQPYWKSIHYNVPLPPGFGAYFDALRRVKETTWDNFGNSMSNVHVTMELPRDAGALWTLESALDANSVGERDPRPANHAAARAAGMVFVRPR